MTKPPHNPRSRTANIAIVVAIVLLAPVVVYVALTALFGPPQLFRRALPEVPPPNTAETVVLPFNAPAVTTDSLYSGAVTVVAVGVGQLQGTAFSDTFYTYTAEDGFGLDEEVSVGLTINEERVPPPPYNTFHIYEFTVDLGADETPITFALPPNDTDDNSGEVTFYIVPGAAE